MQLESVHPTLVLPSTAVQGQWPGNLPWRCCSSCTNGRCRFPTCGGGGKMVGGEESFPHRFFQCFILVRFKRINQSLKHSKIRSIVYPSRWLSSWQIEKLKVTPNLVSYNITLDACAKGKAPNNTPCVFCVAAWVLEVVELRFFYTCRCPPSTEVQLLRCLKK